MHRFARNNREGPRRGNRDWLSSAGTRKIVTLVWEGVTLSIGYEPSWLITSGITDRLI
jgi:hypothetical protein